MARPPKIIDTKPIREAVLGGYMSHRQAAAHFGVSIRQVQKAVSPLKRRMQDRSYYARNIDRYREWNARNYLRRKALALVERLGLA